MTLEQATNDEIKLKIEELSNSSTKTGDIIFEKNSYDCKIIDIPPKYLIYRLSNTRTNIRHLQYIFDHNQDVNFFDLSREQNPEVQEAQHEILVSQITKGLVSSFEDKGGQDEALEIFPNGRIINGNRRTAFMRTQEYPLIKCKVLSDPHLQDKELDLEGDLDIGETGKEDFDDFAIGLAISKLKEEGFSAEQVLKIKSLKNVRHVNMLEEAYKLAHDSLILRQEENNWALIVDKQVYQDAAAANLLSKVSASSRKLISSSAMLLDSASSEGIPGRKYDHMKDIIKSQNIERVEEIFKEEFGVKEVSGGSAFGGGENTVITTFDEVSFNETFLNQDSIDDAILKILTKLNQHKNKLADAGSRKALIKHVNKAAKELQAAEANLHRADLEIGGLEDLLNQIEEYMDKVRTYVRDNS